MQEPGITSRLPSTLYTPQTLTDRRWSSAESSSLETLRELEEYIDATISRPLHSTPQLKLCYHSDSSHIAISHLSNNVDNNGSDNSSGDDAANLRYSDRRQTPDSVPIMGLRWFLVSLALIASNFLFGMNATMIGNAQIFITEEFAEVAKLGWIGVSFSLGAAIVVLPLSKAMNVFDDKWLCVSCLILYESALLLCGRAPSMDAVIVGRLLAGVAGTGLFMM
jgi:hypothetical protein